LIDIFIAPIDSSPALNAGGAPMLAQKYTDEEIIRKINEYMDASEHPDLVGYRKQTRERDFADSERFLWFLRSLASLGGYRNKRILDVGCGFGWHAVGLSLLDPSSEIVGVDILPSAIQGMTECLENFRKKTTTVRVSGVCGDICKLNLETASFDAIYSTEAIEHVHDIQKMIQSCARLLKRGGNLILVNDQNALNQEVRESIIAMWKKREHSPEWSAYLRSIRPVEHKDAKPFAQVREDIIKAANPTLAPEDVDFLTQQTAGLLKTEIEDLALNYRSGMSLPVIQPYDRCRNPFTGEYAERLFDPYALCKIMRKAGFHTHVRHMFRKTPLNWLNGLQFRPLNNLLFKLRPIFVIFGEKI
jgi:ubiquinone/menaquinone biosynthesis C-methylase UbiE